MEVSGKIITLTQSIDYSNTIEYVKIKIANEGIILSDQQVLVFDGRIMQNEHTLGDYNVSNGSTLRVLMRRKQLKTISQEALLLFQTGCMAETIYRDGCVSEKCFHAHNIILSINNNKHFMERKGILHYCQHQNLLEFIIRAVPIYPAISMTKVMDASFYAALANGNVTSNHIYSISMDIAQGLLYLHSIQPHPIIHQYVNATNVLLIAYRYRWIAKLSDDGYVQSANSALVPDCFLYAAPEVHQRETAHQQTVKTDVYSFGVLLIEMLTREMPTGSTEALLRSVQSRWPRFVPLITSCTATDPNQRPSMGRVVDQLEHLKLTLVSYN